MLDNKNYQILDFKQWRLKLNDANQKYEDAEGDYELEQASGEWKVAYMFKEHYGLEDMYHDTIAKLTEGMKKNKTLSDMILTNMHVEGRALPGRLDETNWAYCRFSNANFDDFFSCVNYIGADTMDQAF